MNDTQEELDAMRKAATKDFALTEPILLGVSPETTPLTPEQVAEAIALGFTAARVRKSVKR